MINTDLIETTFLEIGKTYRPGLIRWIRERPDKWARLCSLEDRITKAALAKDHVEQGKALADYRTFFEQQGRVYAAGVLPLLGGGR